jgi:hypothetical protein
MKGVDIMPRGDRTGPFGGGPMTGRGAGFCAGYGVPGYMNPGFTGFRAGFGGGGFGRGWRHRHFAAGGLGWSGWRAPLGWGGYAPYQPSFTQEDELHVLTQQAEEMKNMLSQITKRIDEIQATENVSPKKK